MYTLTQHRSFFSIGIHYLTVDLAMSNIDNISMTSEGIPAQVMCTSGVATPGSTRAQTLVKFVCALVKLLNNQA